jgi:hypothetical protein
MTNQTAIADALKANTEPSQFIYRFLEAFDFPKNTITQVRKGTARNLAVLPSVALKQKLYFLPIEWGNDLQAALESLKANPMVRKHGLRFLIVTDYQNVMAYDLKHDELMECAFSELYLNYAFFLPLCGLERAEIRGESAADQKAAIKMGALFDLIRDTNPIASPEHAQQLNVFLTRLLFCLFAEDTGIFPAQLFTQTLQSVTQQDGSDLKEFLDELFGLLNLSEPARKKAKIPAHLQAFPYVNGGLFKDQQSAPVFSAKARRYLIECGTLDWSEINPDIFGSMFQAVVGEDQRSDLGQHYTSVPNILKVIKPLFLDSLYEQLEQSRGK